MKYLVCLLTLFLSFHSLSCNSLFFPQTVFRQIEDEGKLLSSVKKIDSYGEEIQAGDNVRRVILFENGTAAEGKLSHVMMDHHNQPAYIAFNSETQLMSTDGPGIFLTLKGQGYAQHAGGFGMPVGSPKQARGDVTWFTKEDWYKIDVAPGKDVRLSYPSGVEVTGIIEELQTDASGLVRVIKFVDGSAEAKIGNKILFDKSWGTYDVLIGTRIINDGAL